MSQQAPQYPQNPAHGNGTCEDCGEPCHVYGCRWCPACYDAGNARIREASRVLRSTFPINTRVLAFKVTADGILREIQVVRPDLDLAPIREWANAQAQASIEHDVLAYLDFARRAVVWGEPLPWLPAPSGLTPSVTHNEPN